MAHILARKSDSVSVCRNLEPAVSTQIGHRQCRVVDWAML